MWQRFKNSAMDNWPAWLFAALSVAGAGAVIGLIGQMAAMALSYPLPLGVACAASFLLGCLSTSLLGVRDSMRARAEERRAERRERAERERAQAERSEAEAAERERRERAMAKKFRELDFSKKLFLTILLDAGPHVIASKDEGQYGRFSYGRELSAEGWCTSETVLDGTRYDLSDKARALLASRQELMADARKAIAELSQD